MADNGPYPNDRLDRFETKLDQLHGTMSALAIEQAVIKERLLAVDLVERSRKYLFRTTLTVTMAGVALLTLIFNLLGAFPK